MAHICILIATADVLHMHLTVDSWYITADSLHVHPAADALLMLNVHQMLTHGT
jgi:hypothetical protein